MKMEIGDVSRETLGKMKIGMKWENPLEGGLIN
jgi:hypothetical protein